MKEDQASMLPWSRVWKESRRIALVCAALALVLRVGLAVMMVDRPLDGDMLTYEAQAQSLLAGEGLAIYGNLDNVKGPSYPFLLFLTYRAFGETRLPILLLQDLVAAAVCAGIVLLAWRLTRHRWVAWLAGLAYAFYLPMAIWDNYLLSDSLFTAVSFAFFLTLDAAVRSGRLGTFVLTGALFALSIYLRPTLYYFPLMLVAVFLWWGIPVVRMLKHFAVILIVAAVLLLPWALRNQQVSGVLTPLPAQKMVLYQFWNWKDMRIIDPAPGGEIPPAVRASLATRNWYEVSDSLYHVGLAEVKSNPGQYVVSVVIKTIRQWTNLFWPQPPSKATFLLALVNAGLLLIALPSLFRKDLDRFFRGYAAGALIYITAMGALFSSAEPRFAFWTYPFLMILFAVTSTRLLGKSRG